MRHDEAPVHPYFIVIFLIPIQHLLRHKIIITEEGEGFLKQKMGEKPGLKNSIILQVGYGSGFLMNKKQ